MPSESLTAEQRFRQAFERLKENKPIIVASGTKVSQNNVAKEANCDPSALRKARFPSLIREIQAYVECKKHDQPSKRQKLLKQRSRRSDLKNRLETVTQQRDVAQSQLLSAQLRVIELAAELADANRQLLALQPKSVTK
ncbi:hypothetical protein D3C78_621900 [compost metagenome]